MTYTLNLTDLGYVKDEEHSQWSDLDQQAFPLSGSALAAVTDYEGVKRQITIRGIFTASTLAEIANFMATIDMLQTGVQTTIVFHSDLWGASTTGNYQDGNFNVKVQRFVPYFSVDSPLILSYTITMLEGDPTI